MGEKIGLISAIIALVAVLIGYLWKTFKVYNRLEIVEKRSARQQKDIKTLLSTQFAILDGLKQLGCNGAVSEAHNKLRQHVIDQ
jgi:hypothetical protein